jgi:branched-chain amino acid transport system ATP-binding protein
VLENLLIAAAVRERNWNPFRALSAIPQKREMMDLLELVDCAELADRSAAELAEGQRKLVDIAIALALKPKLLLLDEPTSGVASAHKFRIMEILIDALRKQHVSSVFVEHDMEVVTRYASRVAVWSEGKIQMIGAPDVVMNDPDVIRTVIGGA